MTQRNDVMIDKVFQRLVTAPNELNPTVAEVLIACGRFVGAILKEGYADGDRDRVMAWFIGGLRSYVARSNARASPDRQIRESDQWSPGQHCPVSTFFRTVPHMRERARMVLPACEHKKAAQMSGLKLGTLGRVSNGPGTQDRQDNRKAVWSRRDIDLSQTSAERAETRRMSKTFRPPCP